MEASHLDVDIVEEVESVSMDEDEVNARDVEGAKSVSMDEYEVNARNAKIVIIDY